MKKPHARAPKPHVHEAAFQICSCGAMRADGGEWAEGKGKNPAAKALAVQRALMLTPEQRQRSAATGASKRWKGTTKKQRSVHMQRIAQQPRPSRRNEDRCECGRYTRVYAERRGHVCGKALQAKQAKGAA